MSDPGSTPRLLLHDTTYACLLDEDSTRKMRERIFERAKGHELLFSEVLIRQLSRWSGLVQGSVLDAVAKLRAGHARRLYRILGPDTQYLQHLDLLTTAQKNGAYAINHPVDLEYAAYSIRHQAPVLSPDIDVIRCLEAIPNVPKPVYVDIYDEEYIARKGHYKMYYDNYNSTETTQQFLIPMDVAAI